MLTILCPAISSASYIEVTLLGTGTPRPNIERFGPATLVEVKGKYFVFDTGRGVTIRLQQAGIPLDRIEHIYYTHLHSDHTSGLADLLLTSWIWQRRQQFELTGPTGIQKLAKHITEAYREDMKYRSTNTGLNIELNDIQTVEIASDQVVYDKDGVKITAFLVDHGVVEPAFGYKVESDEQSVVISGDTTYSENLIKHTKNTRLLVHEIAAVRPALLEQNPRLQKVMSYHTSPKQLTEILQLVEPEQTVLTHVLLFGIKEQEVLDEIKSRYNGNVLIGEDLIKIGIGEKITIRGADLNRN